MVQTIEGDFSGAGLRIGIAAARFNSHVVDGLLAGALDGLVRNGVADEAITIAKCPGAWELPLLVKRMAASGSYDAIIALGCVIRGDTPHFDYVAGECAKGVAMVGMDLPVINGVLTTDTVDQALDRAGVKHGNKGFEAAMSAIEMVRL
ncbi:MAG: 6,7-dimethyl-8-ribityllumazine synthase, partial [Planctomycetota bacterium]